MSGLVPHPSGKGWYRPLPDRCPLGHVFTPGKMTVHGEFTPARVRCGLDHPDEKSRWSGGDPTGVRFTGGAPDGEVHG